MKKIILVMSMVFMFGCEMMDNEYRDEFYGKHMRDLELYDMDFGYEDGGLSVEEDIAYIVQEIVKKQVVWAGATDYQARSPKEIWESGEASCLEFCILVSNILYFARGTEVSIGLEYVDVRTIEEGGKVNHAHIIYNGKCYSGQCGFETHPEKIGYSYTFWKTFKKILRE